MWPFNRRDNRAVSSTSTYLVANGQVRAIQSDQDILDMLGVGTGSDGLPLGDRARALAYPASAACLRLISTLTASAPVHVYQRESDGGRKRLRDHAGEKLMNDFASPWMDSCEFIRFMTLEAMFSGEAFAKVIRVRKEPRELNILSSCQVEYDQFTGEPRYRITRKDGGSEILHWRDVIHLKSPTGGAPVKQAAKAIETGLLLEQFANNLFKNGGRKSGILKVAKGRINPADKQEIRKSWDDDKEAGKVHVLDADVDFVELGMSAPDMSHIENRKLQVLEVARTFGVSPTLLAQLDDATLNNSEALFRQLLVTCIDPWFDAWRGALERCLITDDERKAGVYIEHVTADLTSADLKATAEALDKMVGGPILTPNEGRARQNLPKTADGDKLYPPRGAGTTKQE